MRKTIYQYYAYAFFRNLSFYSAVLIPFFTTWGHISLGQTQLLQTWSLMWFFLLEVPTGAVADCFGRKYALMIGSLLVGLTVILYGSIPNYSIFLTCEFLFALSMSMTSGTDEALMYDALKEFDQQHLSKVIFGRAQAFRLGGVLVASLISGFIAQRFGLQATMKAASIPFLISAVIAWYMREPQISKRLSTRKYMDILGKGWMLFQSHRALRLLAFDGIVVASAAYFVFWLYQSLLQQFGVPVIYFGVFNAGLMVIQMIISANFAWLEKFIGSGKQLIQFGALATAAGFFLVGLFPNIMTLIFFILFAGGFGLTRTTLISSYINRYIPSEQRATVLSFISLFRRLFLALIGPLVAFTIDRSLQLTFLMIGLLPLSVFLFSPIEKEMFEGKE